MATQPRTRKTPQDRQPKATKAVPTPAPDQPKPEFTPEEANTAAMQEDLEYQKGQVQYLLQRVTLLRAKVNQQAARIAEMEAE